MAAGPELSRRRAKAHRFSASLLGAYSGSFPASRRLTRAEEIELVRRAAADERRAAELLIEAHFPLLVRTALSFRDRGLAVEDLIGEAIIGMLDAVTRFDPDRGFRFMTYAVWWVRRALVRALVAQVRNVRIPASRLRRQSAEGGVVAFPREISLAEGGASDDELGLEGSLESDSTPLDEEFFVAEERQAVRAALLDLSERQRFVVSERFGIGQDERRTLQSLALELGLTKERVRQIEGQALRLLEHSLGPLMRAAV